MVLFFFFISILYIKKNYSNYIIGNANLVFFGIPIALILAVNFVYFTLTIYNIRSQKMKKSNLRRFSRSKTAADKDVKFYIQIALILGNTLID